MMRHVTPGFRYLLVLALLTALAAAGCGGGKAAKVSGKVTYRGKVLTMGSVVLVGEDGHSARGAIQPDGTYEIDRAPVGKDRAAVSNPPPAGARGGQALVGSPNDEEAKQARALAAQYVPTPEKYNDPQKSGLSFDVPSGGRTLDIDLQ
jgi:hypothetical protein